ncbi:MAG: TetR/AcrR family transcriptional regulator [Verrucomicrobiota bacterium]
MGVTERKERERQLREELFIAEADLMLAENGYLALNLDELAKQVEYSKATLYNHFTSKEDLVLAVTTKHMQTRGDYFERANLYQAPSRERIFACGIGDRLLSRQLPHSFSLSQLVCSPSIWSKCSAPRQKLFESREERVFAHCSKILYDAVAQNDLDPQKADPEQITWGLVSLSKGSHLINNSLTLEQHSTSERSALDYLFDNYHLLLDGAQWRPLSSEVDYRNIEQKIREDLFSQEFAALNP